MKIRKVKLLAQNLLETERFYATVLGLTIHEKSAAAITFLVGDCELTFLKTDTLKPIYHFAFDIPNNQLYEAHAWITAKVPVIEFEGKAIINFPDWNAKSLYFLDNNGNILEFIARFDLDNERPAPFDSSHILSVSEIAFVTSNVPALGEKLISENGFSFFSKQMPRPDFSVIGDDNGLIILVDSSRNWFPTTIKAAHFWMNVSVENNGHLITLENE